MLARYLGGGNEGLGAPLVVLVELAGEGDGDAASDHLRQDKEAARDAVRKVEEEGGGGDEEGRAKGVAVAGAPAAPPEAAVVAHRAAKPGEDAPGGAVAWAAVVAAVPRVGGRGRGRERGRG